MKEQRRKARVRRKTKIGKIRKELERERKGRHVMM